MLTGFASRSLFFTALATAGCGAAGPPPLDPVTVDGGDPAPVGGLPRVLQVSPAADARGVRADATIVLRFSEPMDRDSTQKAWSSAQIRGPQFVWSASSTQVTITPGEPLPYASGDANVAARRFDFALGNGAATTSGRFLTPFQSRFYTLREVKDELPSDPLLDGYVRRDETDTECTVDTEEGAICVGDSDGEANLQYKGLVTFDLGKLPDGIADFVFAELRAYQYSVGNGPYDTLGAISAEHIIYDERVSAFSTARLALIGRVSIDPMPGWKATDNPNQLAGAVKSDYADRVRRRNRTQYRLLFSTETDRDDDPDVAKFYSGRVRFSNREALRGLGPKLTVRYLLP